MATLEERVAHLELILGVSFEPGGITVDDIWDDGDDRYLLLTVRKPFAIVGPVVNVPEYVGEARESGSDTQIEYRWPKAMCPQERARTAIISLEILFADAGI